MPDFSFYTHVFGGSTIPEAEFYSCMRRAGEELSQLKRRFRVTGQEDMALCAMAEAVYAARLDPGISAATVGSMSVKYHARSAQSLYRSASRYLEIYRGVAQ